MNEETITEFEDEYFCTCGNANNNICQREKESMHDGTLSGLRDEGVTRVKKKVKM